ncbi:MAG: hypothetical protein ACFFER_03530 [Candidatus Thorarchaeota archaeon]
MWIIEYEESATHIEIEGYSAKGKDEFYAYLEKTIVPCLKWQAGIPEESLIEDIAGTDFEADEIREALSEIGKLNETKWGEIFGACVHQNRYGIYIPIPVQWTDRNPESSSAGADIIGFTNCQGSTAFLFGEVKTSSEETVPPRVIYGNRGLISQIKSLVGKRGIYSAQWLMKQSLGRNWHEQCKEAVRLFVKKQYRIVGVLIRDTNPDQADLTKVYNECKQIIGPKIFLTAFYLPDSIRTCMAQSCTSGGLPFV